MTCAVCQDEFLRVDVWTKFPVNQSEVRKVAKSYSSFRRSSELMHMKPDSLLRKYDLIINKDVSACRPKSPAHAHADRRETGDSSSRSKPILYPLPRASSSSTGRVGARMKATRISLRAALLLLLGALLQLVVLLSFLLCLVVIAASRLLLSLHRALLS